MLEKVFKLSENKTDAKTEILAGITTFMSIQAFSQQRVWIQELYLLPLLWQHLSEHCSWQSLQTIHLHWHLVWD